MYALYRVDFVSNVKYASVSFLQLTQALNFIVKLIAQRLIEVFFLVSLHFFFQKQTVRLNFTGKGALWYNFSIVNQLKLILVILRKFIMEIATISVSYKISSSIISLLIFLTCM